MQTLTRKLFVCPEEKHEEDILWKQQLTSPQSEAVIHVRPLIVKTRVTKQQESVGMIEVLYSSLQILD